MLRSGLGDLSVEEGLPLPNTLRLKVKLSAVIKLKIIENRNLFGKQDCQWSNFLF